MNYYLDELFTQSTLPYEGIILGNPYALKGINASRLSKCFCNLGWHGLNMYYSYRLLISLAVIFYMITNNGQI